MVRTLTLALFCMAALVPIGVSAPMDGSLSKSLSPSEESDGRLQPGASWTMTKTFRGGERACVLTSAGGGPKDTYAQLELAVYDSKNVLVAVDKATSAVVGDFVCVIWYPPRDGDYRIELKNPSVFPRACYIAIK